MAESSRFWDFMAKRYAKTPMADEASYLLKIEKAQEYLRPNMRVMEFGCGTGSTALLHAPHVQQLLATDISTNMIAIAQDKLDGSTSNLEFRQATLADLEQEEPFDVVMGMNILHLLPDLDDTLERVQSLLKPGGLFISSTPCLTEMDGLLFKVVAPIGSALRILPRFNRFGRGELIAALEQHGFWISHEWTPGKGKALFVVAEKAAS
jgi:2-polyprenyl-3-methyl-5-hydroxy-6-metoxy-1,4-benzoquinol methylase